jgi:tetratricopeptide (TPR) repeat protein
VLLAIGDVAGARTELDAILAQNPSALRPLVLLSSIELRQNRPDRAREVAERALAANAQSVGALIAASEAAQARFELRAALAYLDRAIAIDDRDVHALVNRARLRFGNDDTRGAREDADRAASIAPNDAQVKSLRGFIRLADLDLARARADFEAAVQADRELGEPHLGLGLIHFREGRTNAGLLEMLTATLLEPKVALYQSYLGKAYYQAGRFPEGLAALSSAKRLDPRDPTPWLYSSLYLRDQNRQVEALQDLRQAIGLNDNRAVYRGRLLLDRDLATKNVSLAELYRQLGFEAWGAYEALNSLETDVTNASAHLFLAETYGGLPDRTQAQGSELLQYFLYSPVNRNSFNNFAEYTALLEQPRRQLSVITETGSHGYKFGDVVSRTGNERIATVAFIEGWRRDGARLNVSDERVQGFFQGKVALGRRSDLFFNFSGVKAETGASESTTVVLGRDSDTPVILQQFAAPDRLVVNELEDAETTIGLKHTWRPGSALTATARYDDFEFRTGRENATDTSLCLSAFDLTPFGAVSTGRIVDPSRTLDFQVQQATQFGRHQIVAGFQSSSVDKEHRCSERLSTATESFDFSSTPASGRDSATIGHVRDEIQLTPRIHATVGVEYQRAKYRDLTDLRTTKVDELNPRVGLSARLTSSTVIRAAAFSQLNTNFRGDYIAPPTVSGFVVSRNELPTARRDEYNLALEHSASRTFVGVRGFYRETAVAAGGFSLAPEADASGKGVAALVNWIAAPRLSVFGDNQFIQTSAAAFDRYDNLARLGLNFIHPRGFSFRVTGSHISQRFTDTRITDLPRSNFVLVDLEAGYEFAGKRGLATVRVQNALDRRFSSVIENVSIDPFLPDRRGLLTLRWRLW